MHDDQLRRQVAGAPVPAVTTPSFAAPAKPLAESVVAVVTTAALHHADQSGFDREDESFRELHDSRRDLVLGHLSQNYDRSGFLADPNVLLPVDRLRQLAGEGVIGGVSDINLSFFGAVRGNLSSMQLDSGPRAARVLKDAGVDVVLLTPACPMCTRTVCVLGHVFDRHGIPSTVLALVREHAESLRPPRALFVEFPFGRPVGPPGDAAFQQRVLRRALDLVESASGPTLVDFDEAYPTVEDAEAVALECVIAPSFDPTVPAAVEELRGLVPTREHGIELTQGRSGAAITEPKDLEEGLLQLSQLLDETTQPTDDRIREAARMSIEVRSFYEVAGTALVLEGGPDAPANVTDWFYRRTQAGILLRLLDDHLRELSGVDEPWRNLVPRAYRIAAG